MRAFVCVGFCFSIPSQEIGLGNVSRMTCFVSSGRWNLNSVNELWMHVMHDVAYFDCLLKVASVTSSEGFLLNTAAVLTADSAVRTDSLLCHLLRTRWRRKIDRRPSVSGPGKSGEHHQRFYQQRHRSGQSIWNFGCSADIAAAVLISAGRAGLTSHPRRRE